MAVDIVIKNGKLVSPTEIISAGIAVDKGKIVAIGNEGYLPPADRTVDAGGKYVLPGIIDAHYHFGSYQGLSSSCKTESVAGAAGGVTTLGLFPMEPGRSLLDIVDEWQKAFDGVSAVDYFLHGSILAEVNMGEISKCLKVGINSFKLVLGYKGKQAEKLGLSPADDAWIYRAFSAISKLKCRPVWAQVHAENGDILAYLREKMEASGRKDAGAWRDSAPSFVEAEAIKRSIALAEYLDCPLYIVHNTIAESVDIIKEAKNRGKIELKMETCPQYLTHNSDELLQIFKDNPALVVINPPLRDKESNERLWEGIRDGVVDVVGSDNGLNTFKIKGNDIWNTFMGLGNLIEMTLPIMLSEGVNKGRISLRKVVEVLCLNPAVIFGIFPKKGTIAVGSDADIVIVDLEKKVKFKEKDSYSGCDWNIYEGWDFKGWPVMTILRGQIVVEDRKFLGPRNGQYVPCECK